MHLLTMLLAVTFLLCQQSFNKIFVDEISLRDPLIYVLLITHRQSINDFFLYSGDIRQYAFYYEF